MEFKWHDSKEKTLEEQKRPSFQSVVTALANGGYVAEIENPRYSGQKILVVRIEGEKHLCAVPFTQTGDVYFFHTVHPSRNLSKLYPGR